MSNAKQHAEQYQGAIDATDADHRNRQRREAERDELSNGVDDAIGSERRPSSRNDEDQS
jgi:hypothetical protein